jgi:hypothetical protein
MSVTGVSGLGVTGLDATEQNNNFKKVKSDFDALATALKAGDLSAAKTAYAQVQQDMKNAPSLNGQSSSQNQGADAFKALGDDLNSGDITAAQKDFASMQAQGSQRAHHHHHHSQNTATQIVPANTTDTTQSAAGIDITA